MKYFRKFQANKEKFAENEKAFLAKTSQRACPPVFMSPCVAQHSYFVVFRWICCFVVIGQFSSCESDSYR